MDSALIIANLFACLAGGFVCVCRMGAMPGADAKPSIRFQYFLWFTMFVASGISWLYGQPATIMQFVWSCAVLAYLVIGYGAWRHGAPSYTIR